MNKVFICLTFLLLTFNCNNPTDNQFDLDRNWTNQDINPSSSTYGVNIGPSFYRGKVSLYYFPKSPT